MKEEVNKLISEIGPSLKSYTSKTKLWIGFLGVIILWGLYGLFIMFKDGHIVLGTRDNVVWGIFIVNFIFMIGLGYAGAIIAGIFRLFRLKWRAPVMRITLWMALFATIIGPLFILFEIGRFDRLHYLFIYPRIQSPIIWDVLAVITFITGAFLLSYFSLIRDFALLREDKTNNFSESRKKWYRWFSLGFTNKESERKSLTFSQDLLSVIIIPVAIIVSSILSWIFGMTLRPGWNSTIFGPYFVLAAIYSGAAMIILIMYIFRNTGPYRNQFTDDIFTKMGFVLITLGAGYGYFTFSEYFTEWYTSERWTEELMVRLFSWEEYGGWTFFANIVGILLPLIVIGIPWFRNVRTITFVSVVAIVALWIKRYLIVIPTLETTLIPPQDVRPDYVSYSATWVEWAVVCGGFAGFALLFTLGAQFVPMISLWETSKAEHEESKHHETVSSKSQVSLS